MKFISLYKHAETGVPPSQEEMTRMGKLVEEGMKAGWLLLPRKAACPAHWEHAFAFPTASIP